MRLKRIDALRALSIMLVLFAHAGITIVPGGTGVTIFFVISGFVITNVLVNEYRQIAGFRVIAFFARRALKILPPLLALAIIPSALLFKPLNLELEAVASQIFFYYNWFILASGESGVLPWTGVVWSLAIEEQFYISIALFWLLAVRARNALQILTYLYVFCLTYSSVARIVISLTTTLPHDSTGNLPRIYFGSDCRMSGIALGGLVAILQHHASSSPGSSWKKFSSMLSSQVALWVALIVLLVSLVIRNEFFRDTFRFSLQESCAAVLVLTAASAHGWPKLFSVLAENRIVQCIGLSSYTVYLSHLAIFALLQTQLNIRLPVWLMVPVTLAVGYLLHLLLDAPFEKYRRSWRISNDQNIAAGASRCTASSFGASGNRVG